MKLIELHILQSFPVSCLNRDDVGSPKSAIFGGVNRARISSQCLKRAIREKAQELAADHFSGQRSRLFIEPLQKQLQAQGVDEEKALNLAKQVFNTLATADQAAEKKGLLKAKTLMFLSPLEIESIAKELANAVDKNLKAADLKKAISKACKSAALKDGADIAIFGRMVASEHSLTLEGAGLFSHALSTHRASNEIDFFAAVDDLQSEDDAGAGMTDTLEFTSATYYRYLALNLDLLADANHLGALSPEERKSVVDSFLRAAILAVPGARKNSMNASTLPGYVLGLVKEKGQPVQLINAFEKPVFTPGPKRGLMEPSIEAIKTHHEQVKKTWGIDAKEFAIPEMTLEHFCKEMVKHVG